MRDQPNRSDLLAIARQILKEQIIPHLPEEQRYNGLMIANAMAIAARQFKDEGLCRELEKLHALLEAFPLKYQAINRSAASETAVKQALKALINLVRNGQFDDGCAETSADRRPLQALLRDYLSLHVLQRVRESNPKALPANRKR